MERGISRREAPKPLGESNNLKAEAYGYILASNTVKDAIEVVNEASKDEGQKSDAEAHLKDLNSMLMRIEQVHGGYPDKGSSEEQKWESDPRLRDLYASVTYVNPDMPQADQDLYEARVEALEAIVNKLKANLDSGVATPDGLESLDDINGKISRINEIIARAEAEVNTPMGQNAAGLSKLYMEDRRAELEALAKRRDDILKSIAQDSEDAPVDTKNDASPSALEENTPKDNGDSLVDKMRDSAEKIGKTIMSKKIELARLRDSLAEAGDSESRKKIEADIKRVEGEISQKESLRAALEDDMARRIAETGANEGENKRSEGEEDYLKLLGKFEKRSQEEEKSYSEALREFAKAKAEVEFKGKKNFQIFGKDIFRNGDRRAKAYEEAAKNLKDKALAYVTREINEKQKNGEYSGTEGQISDAKFDMLRGILSKEVREATEVAHKERNERWYNRVLARIGSWINTGDKQSNLAAGAVGFGYGFGKSAAVTALTGIFGVAFPLSGLAGFGAAFAGNASLKRGVRLDELNSRQTADEIVNDKTFGIIKGTANKKENSDEWFVDTLLSHASNDSERIEAGLSNAVDRRMRENRAALMIGRAAGGLAGVWAVHEITGHFSGDTAKAEDSSSRDPEGSDNSDDSDDVDKTGGGSGTWTEMDIRIAEATEAGDYPWDVAEKLVGKDRAMEWIDKALAKAKEDGHLIERFTTADGSVGISVDGYTDTTNIMSVVGRYAELS